LPLARVVVAVSAYAEEEEEEEGQKIDVQQQDPASVRNGMLVVEVERGRQVVAESAVFEADGLQGVEDDEGEVTAFLSPDDLYGAVDTSDGCRKRNEGGKTAVTAVAQSGAGDFVRQGGVVCATGSSEIEATTEKALQHPQGKNAAYGSEQVGFENGTVLDFFHG